MFRLTQRDIQQGYKGIRKLALEAVKKNDYCTALSYIHHCSTIAGQFNWIYSDAIIEDLLQKIAEGSINKSETDLCRTATDGYYMMIGVRLMYW